MKLLLSLLAIALLNSCASQESPRAYEDPFSKSFVPDEVEPTSQTDLKELLTTLPIFDMPPGTRRAYVDRSAQLTPGAIKLVADGSQTAAGLRKLPGAGEYEFRHGWEGAIGTDIYRIKRMERGWQIISRKSLKTGIKMAGDGPA